MTSNNTGVLKKYIGKSMEIDDLISEFPIKGMAALLDYDFGVNSTSGMPLPEGWHWLYFLDTPLQNQLGSDGHKKREGFIPPISLPRRMHAGSSLTFLAPICVGDKIKKVSNIKNIETKNGSTGNLTFLTIENFYFKREKKMLSEVLNIVYREQQNRTKVASRLKTENENFEYEKIWNPTPEMLFRYSALTFNSHRIHYDYPYSTEVEGYKNIVVHGPLLATLILDLVREVAEEEKKKIYSLSYRVNSPVFVGGKIKIQGSKNGDDYKFWVKDCEEKIALSSIVNLEN